MFEAFPVSVSKLVTGLTLLKHNHLRRDMALNSNEWLLFSFMLVSATSQREKIDASKCNTLHHVHQVHRRSLHFVVVSPSNRCGFAATIKPGLGLCCDQHCEMLTAHHHQCGLPRGATGVGASLETTAYNSTLHWMCGGGGGHVVLIFQICNLPSLVLH